METKKNRPSPRKRLVNLLVHILLGFLAFIWVTPIIWIVLTSFRTEKGSYVKTFFPTGYTLDNYIKLFTDRNVLNFPKM
jgi:arabinogalactan oligomer/maltooligosaccharide transport system permease protein